MVLHPLSLTQEIPLHGVRLIDDPPQLAAQGIHTGFVLDTPLKPLFLFAASEHEASEWRRNIREALAALHAAEDDPVRLGGGGSSRLAEVRSPGSAASVTSLLSQQGTGVSPPPHAAVSSAAQEGRAAAVAPVALPADAPPAAVPVAPAAVDPPPPPSGPAQLSTPSQPAAAMDPVPVSAATAPSQPVEPPPAPPAAAAVVPVAAAAPPLPPPVSAASSSAGPVNSGPLDDPRLLPPHLVHDAQLRASRPGLYSSIEDLKVGGDYGGGAVWLRGVTTAPSPS